MRFVTLQDFQNMKLYELDNTTYKRVEMALIAATDEIIAKGFLEKAMEKTLREFSTLDCVDIHFMDILNIIG